MLTDAQVERYSHHIILKGVGGKGQQKLLDGRVLIIGAGGLGSPAALYLTAAGVGTIGLVDADVVDLSNLQRQVIHHTGDLGREKVFSASAKMKAINPEVKVITYPTFICAENVSDLISDYDFVLDCTGNLPAKFLINDACVLAGIPYSHAGIAGFLGQTMTVNPGHSACYRCVFPKERRAGAVPGIAEAGVLGALPGIIGTMQASEAIKYLLGVGTLLYDRMLIFDAMDNEFVNAELVRNPDCPLCGARRSITALDKDARQLAAAGTAANNFLKKRSSWATQQHLA